MTPCHKAQITLN